MAVWYKLTDRSDFGIKEFMSMFWEFHDFHINTTRDFEHDWIMGASIIAVSEDTLFWGDQEKMDIEDIKKCGSWVYEGKLLWVVTDGKGETVELPHHYQYQTWNILNYDTGKYETSEHVFHPIPCEDNEIL